jgi:C4-type Zn-finger protein
MEKLECPACGGMKFKCHQTVEELQTGAWSTSAGKWLWYAPEYQTTVSVNEVTCTHCNYQIDVETFKAATKVDE